jgi:hypothetical protein
MTLRAFWRVARFGALGLAVAVVIGLTAQPAEARGHWRWNGYNYVWIEAPYYAPYGPGYYYPPAYYYPPPPVVYAPPYYGPSVGFSFRIH